MNNYVYWPVILNGRQYHITLKYLGDVDVKPDKVLAALKPFKTLLPLFYDWEPVVFNSGNEIHYVLEFTKFAALIPEMHDALNFRPDDFPTYRPHITVPKDVWDKAEKFELADLYTGRLQYKYNAVDHRFNYTFGEVIPCPK